MRALLPLALFAVSAPLCLAQSLGAPSDTAPTAAPVKPLVFDATAIDKTADPCTDFYQYACGNWVKQHPIPADRTTWGRFNELADYNNYLLYADLKKAADAPKTPLQKKYGDFFVACMNTAAIDARGLEPVKGELATVASLKSSKDLAAVNVKLIQLYGGGSEFFRVGVTVDQVDASKQILATGQGGLSLPDRDYYLSDEPRMAKIREQYLTHMTKMFGLMGDPQDVAATEAASVLRIETALARGSMSRVEMRDPAKRYHIMTIAQLQALSPDYDWKAHLAGVGMASAPTIDVTSPGYVTAVNDVLAKEPLDALKSYMRWHTVHSAAPWLSQPFVDANFEFFAQTLNGQKEQLPRWKRCTTLVDQSMGEAVGQDWVRENFPPSAKDNMEKLVKALEVSLGKDIQQLDWMSPATKAEAEKKLDAIRHKIGYPATWRDYSKLEVKRADLLGDVERTGSFEYKRDLSKYGKPVDETEWGMTPPTVNAYYNPPMNDINFPAGILQPPFFDNAKDAAVNFGGIGVVIGHEMTHGFDDQGSKYDLHGNVRQWWTDEDLAKFKARTECIASEYDGFNVAPGQNLNGHLTLGENTADNGGIRIAYQALLSVMAKDAKATESIDGYTPSQRFFLSFGQIWCENRTEQIERVRAKTDPHSSGKWRVDGTVQNFDEFGKAFGCKVGQPMMPVSGGCRVW
ncbi:endothelin-converting enzyme Metallo peptidase. MEROPS family M13 [Bryocella elongata]|uniref:Endothelin-converting enzyme Metallo peptidase. MEROPS family M13 n=1 Tax=Bryocella elongata TaxID=863522 RepID=A0A1H6BN67_9BACT|nr:M13 family metallopeptidase [Bryocella elongata]SEG62159.1 endothelin-converting enzyme Metallo peptidase. MEROPS family M13 [Bryocella elongata]